MTDKPFNPRAMKRATPADIARMWVRLWGEATPEQARAIVAQEYPARAWSVVDENKEALAELDAAITKFENSIL